MVFFNPYTEAEALKRIDQFGEALISRRGVPMNGFLFDDGWDDRLGNWGFSKDFPTRSQQAQACGRTLPCPARDLALPGWLQQAKG